MWWTAHTYTNISIVCASIKLISATHEIFERCNQCDKVAAHSLSFFPRLAIVF